MKQSHRLAAGAAVRRHVRTCLVCKYSATRVEPLPAAMVEVCPNGGAVSEPATAGGLQNLRAPPAA